MSGPHDPGFYCDNCEIFFRIPAEEIRKLGQYFSISCPGCGAPAKIERLSDGRIEVSHSHVVHAASGILVDHPLFIVAFYTGIVVVVLLAVATAIRMVEPIVCPVVAIAAIVLIMIVVWIPMPKEARKDWLKLMRTVSHALPILWGRKLPQGNARS